MPAFNEPRYVASTFSINIPRRLDIRRSTESFERILEGNYGPAQVLPVPDEMDPLMPRLVFSSTHGFSRILVSQINIAFAVLYSENWQIDASKREDYIQERAKYLFDLAGSLNTEVFFCGLTTDVQAIANVGDDELLANINRRLLSSPVSPNLFEILVRTSKVIKNHYFSNLTISNFRDWPQARLADVTRFTIPLRRGETSARGININCDFNDRYAFNEIDTYRSNYERAKDLLSMAFRHLQQQINETMGEANAK